MYYFESRYLVEFCYKPPWPNMRLDIDTRSSIRDVTDKYCIYSYLFDSTSYGVLECQEDKKSSWQSEISKDGDIRTAIFVHTSHLYRFSRFDLKHYA